MSSIYNYVASTNPQGAREVIQSFGYNIVDTKNMGNNLRQLVAREGEPALKAILAIHPERDVIMEMNKPEATEKKCGCGGNCGKSEQFMNADGIITAAGLLSSNKHDANSVTNDSNKLAQQNNGLIIAAAILLGVIIFKLK